MEVSESEHTSFDMKTFNYGKKKNGPDFQLNQTEMTEFKGQGLFLSNETAWVATC